MTWSNILCCIFVLTLRIFTFLEKHFHYFKTCTINQGPMTYYCKLLFEKITKMRREIIILWNVFYFDCTKTVFIMLRHYKRAKWEMKYITLGVVLWLFFIFLLNLKPVFSININCSRSKWYYFEFYIKHYSSRLRVQNDNTILEYCIAHVYIIISELSKTVA